MMDHTENTLRAAQKALTDVVGPSVDQSDPLASEQLRLVVEYIEFVRDRLDDINDRVMADLLHSITLGRRCRERMSNTDQKANLLEESLVFGESLVSEQSPHPQVMKDAATAINDELTTVIRTLGETDQAAFGDIQKIIVTSYKSMLDFERAWFLPFGFDPEPAKALPIHDALAVLKQEHVDSTH